MKKLHFLLYSFICITPFTSQARFIEILAQDGSTLQVSDSQTVQDFFQQCRKDGHCKTVNEQLVLDFNNKLIKENSPEANRKLWLHSSWNSNTATIATLKYPQRKINYTSFFPKPTDTLISIEAPNGRIKQCALHETPAYFFRKCRNSGDCKDPAAMTLKFGNFEIHEDSEIANRPFGSFNTDSYFAQVRRSR